MENKTTSNQEKSKFQLIKQIEWLEKELEIYDLLMVERQKEIKRLRRQVGHLQKSLFTFTSQVLRRITW